jgi:hypothetical protein
MNSIRHREILLLHEGVSKSFWTGCLEWELQMVHLSETRCSCITILCVSLVSSATTTLCVASQWVFIVVSIYFIIGSVWQLLDTPLYSLLHVLTCHCWPSCLYGKRTMETIYWSHYDVRLFLKVKEKISEGHSVTNVLVFQGCIWHLNN